MFTVMDNAVHTPRRVTMSEEKAAPEWLAGPIEDICNEAELFKPLAALPNAEALPWRIGVEVKIDSLPFEYSNATHKTRKLMPLPPTYLFAAECEVRMIIDIGFPEPAHTSVHDIRINGEFEVDGEKITSIWIMSQREMVRLLRG